MRQSNIWGMQWLSRRSVLWLLFISNLLGTIYGYIWYADQLKFTWGVSEKWQVIFVPDSPTASLFFTLSILFLLYSDRIGKYFVLRTIIEALAVVTSVKYGIWAVSMIFAGVYQGGELVWQDWMLISSHLAMAIEAILYVRWFKCGIVTLMYAGAWTLLNDLVDYSFYVFPWLPEQLWDDVNIIMVFTIILTFLSVMLAVFLVKRRDLTIERNRS